MNIPGMQEALDERKECTGDVDTCPIDECTTCGERECPFNEPLHFHHDGCPVCDFPKD